MDNKYEYVSGETNIVFTPLGLPQNEFIEQVKNDKHKPELLTIDWLHYSILTYTCLQFGPFRPKRKSRSHAASIAVDNSVNHSVENNDPLLIKGTINLASIKNPEDPKNLSIEEEKGGKTEEEKMEIKRENSTTSLADNSSDCHKSPKRSTLTKNSKFSRYQQRHYDI